MRLIPATKIVLKGTTLVLDLYHDSATDTHRRILALNPMMVNLKLELFTINIWPYAVKFFKFIRNPRVTKMPTWDALRIRPKRHGAIIARCILHILFSVQFLVIKLNRFFHCMLYTYSRSFLSDDIFYSLYGFECNIYR